MTVQPKDDVMVPPGPRSLLMAFMLNGWLRLIFRRLLMGMVLILIVSGLSFVLASLAPGDPARMILGANASPPEYAALRQSLGLDLPVYEQYWNWLTKAVAGDLGTSIFSSTDVTTLISQRLPVTASLIPGALLVSLVAGVGLGVISAVRGGVVGRVVDGLVVFAFSLPSFWLGAVLVLVFAVELRLFPATGYTPLSESPTGWIGSLILPVTALSSFGVASIAKQMRDAMLDILGSEYIRMARASGVSPISIIFKHALKNAAVRIVTILGILAVVQLGGTVVIESVFAMPGLGRLVVEATTRHDIPVLQGVVVCFTAVVVVINLVVDIAYARLNPKVGAR